MEVSRGKAPRAKERMCAVEVNPDCTKLLAQVMTRAAILLSKKRWPIAGHGPHQG